MFLTIMVRYHLHRIPYTLLATKNVEKKWTTRYPNWDMIYNEECVRNSV